MQRESRRLNILDRFGMANSLVSIPRGFASFETDVCLGSSSDAARRYTPDAAAVNNLLGRLLLGIGDVKRAAEFFVEALRLNPFMWDAFENLCNIGMSFRSRIIHN